jgi:hypothetical protein
MIRSRQGSKARRWLAGFTVLVVVAGMTLIPATSVAAATPDHTVLVWNRYAVDALSNPLPTAAPTPAVPGAALTPPVASIHLAIVQGAVYDAVNAIDRGHEPYLDGLPRASRFASKAAAVATAAHHVLVGLTRGATTTPLLPDVVRTRLDNLWRAKLAQINAGAAKRNGIRIGAAVAAAWLADRSNDLRFGTFRFTPATGTVPGEWKVTPPANGNDPNAWVARVRPFTLTSTSQFRTTGPLAISSPAYVLEYNEVKALGARTGSTRTAQQTDLALFYSTNPLPMINRALRQIATARNLSISQQARLFVMTSMAGADALINCWDDKNYYHFWRPITAIRADDGNPLTMADGAWSPLLDGPPYPDHPSGYNCYTAGTMYTAKRFFGTDNVRFQLTSATPSLTTPTRTYTHFTAVLTDTIEARLYLGFHFRTPDAQGAVLGQKVAGWVATHFFRPVR